MMLLVFLIVMCLKETLQAWKLDFITSWGFLSLNIGLNVPIGLLWIKLL